MRILQVCSARLIGGGERYLADLSNSLAQRGHDVFAVLAPDSPVAEEFRHIPPNNIKHARMRNAADIRGALKLARHVRETNAQIIHAHVARDYPLAAIASKRTGVPFVLTRHLLFPMKKLQGFALKAVSGIIAPSRAIADALKAQGLFHEDKITTIPHGIDASRFAPNPEAKEGSFTVGTIGHLNPIKGHDVFLRAANIVLDSKPNIRFQIVGEDKSTSGKNRREIESLREELDLVNKVELVGWTDDIRPYLSDFDLFVSAAREEAFGLVMVEAMLTQTPVLAVKNEGATEIIENEKSGIIVPLNDHEALAKKILELYENRAKLESLGANGLKHALKNFSLDVMIDKTEEFYQQVLSR